MDNSESVYHVLVIDDPSFEREIPLDAATYSIGRHSSNDIVLSCQKTSRNHATLLRRTDVKTNKCSYWILDGDLQGNRSRNGIFINGKKSLVHELKAGDVIQFSGDAHAKYKNHYGVDKAVNKSPILNSNESPSNLGVKTIDKETIITPNSEIVVNNRSKYQESGQYNSLADLSPHPIIEIDFYGNVTYINSAGLASFKDIQYQKLNHPLLDNLIAQYHQGSDKIVEREVTIEDKTFQQTAHYLPEKIVIRNYIIDITQQKTIATQLERQIFLYNQITQQISEGIIIFELATKQIVEVNSSCTHWLGYSGDEMLQMNIYELLSESQRFAAILRKIVTEKNSFWGEYPLSHKNGNIVNAKIKIDLINLPHQERICLVIHNVLEEQESPTNSSKAVDYLSQRKIFKQQLITAIANAKRSQKLLAVMFCQLGFLPDIRLTIGTDKSKKLLLALGERLSTCLRGGDTIIPWEEDKFALLLPQISGAEEVAKINQRIQKSIEQSFKIGDTQVTISSTIGIAIYPQDGDEEAILLASANTASIRASQNKTSYQFYDESMNAQSLVALEMESLLQKAIDQQEFKLYYQPQINIDSGKPEAIEAILHWQHPELGVVTFKNFIKSAEQSKLILPIGEWLIRQACNQIKVWQSDELPSLKIIISLSSVQFRQANIVQTIAAILTEIDIDAHLLELEISATSLMENIDYSRHLLEQLKELGVCIAIDGFTAGFSSLEYLKQFSLDTLKIDHSLIAQLTDDPQNIAIVTALIQLGKGFNLRVVAEGVETQEQFEILRRLNCQHMQGAWFSNPLQAESASKLLQLNFLEPAQDS
ncbi:diguanylate cyclase/phosphodiesterase with PAS/PAC sensor(s) [Chondrocystis sp. NIES-4102]|nr:diguanylate cyclase/phosphodiesterase with PAS/PAC sensor(s) [Chondrocystis sp. NIES-4102]